MSTAIQQPSTEAYKFKHVSGGTLLIACGALAKEIVQIIEINHLESFDVQCLPAKLHHRPSLIPAAIEDLLEKHYEKYKNIYVVYGD